MAKATTEPGFINRHGQRVLRKTGLPGSDYLHSPMLFGVGTVATSTARTGPIIGNVVVRSARRGAPVCL
jgi:hypothetical protein